MVLDTLQRVLRYAFYDWTRETPRPKRIAAWVGILLQGYAVYGLWTRSLAWPVMWPRGAALYVAIALLYIVGAGITNAVLTSEFFRKTQLESDQIAARQIQRTLQPQKVGELPGYDVDTFYQPFRDVGGDYFDVIDLPGSRTLFAMADVSGKGMPAALLAANIQALVRSIASVDAEPLTLARRIDEHLGRYTPTNRFATAVFVVLSRESGELTYVNAGHNPPMVVSPGSVALLEATGLPLGLIADSEYGARSAVLPAGGALLLYTDGLTDSMAGENPEGRLRDALSESAGAMTRLESLLDARSNVDDVAILLVKRRPALPDRAEN